MSNSDFDLDWLQTLCANQDWYVGVEQVPYQRYVVYAEYIDSQVLRFVPDLTPSGKQVLCHFAASSKDSKTQYLNKVENSFALRKFVESSLPVDKNEVEIDEIADTPEQEEALELNVRLLTDELDRLEKICGTNILGEIFFEVHDKENAVTNLGSKYPEVKQRMQKLYDQFGFDILYGELEL
jgi:hypothetical protein